MELLFVFTQPVDLQHWLLRSPIRAVTAAFCVCVLLAVSHNWGYIFIPSHCENQQHMQGLIWTKLEIFWLLWVILSTLHLRLLPVSPVSSPSSSSLLLTGLRLAEQLARREDEAKIRHRLGLSLWASGNLEEAQHQVKLLPLSRLSCFLCEICLETWPDIASNLCLVNVELLKMSTIAKTILKPFSCHLSLMETYMLMMIL